MSEYLNLTVKEFIELHYVIVGILGGFVFIGVYSSIMLIIDVVRTLRK